MRVLPRHHRRRPRGNRHSRADLYVYTHPRRAALEPPGIPVTLDTTGQHTLSWKVPISLKDGPDEPIEPGSCNLYLFPAVVLASGKKLSPSARQLEALQALLVAVFGTDAACEFAKQPDAVGAFPIHAVTVANTEEAIKMAELLFMSNPDLLKQVHTKHRAGFPLFTGESSLHICCVNRREALLCKLIDLMMDRFTAEEARALLGSQAGGVFFNEMPMRNYGGTPLAYALCFDLRDAVTRLLKTSLVNVNDPDARCEITGFLPIHAVTANGLSDTYDWMTTQLPEEIRAKEKLSGVGRFKRANTQGLTPVQLAAKLGDHKMVKHILRKQTIILWIWGPVTQHSISLKGIDSAGEGGGDIMELIAQIDASRRTRELVLDTFMTGFIYSLYREKWKKFGYKLYYARLLVDCILLICLVTLSFALKSSPDNQEAVKPLCIAMLVLIGILVIEELRVGYLYVKNYAFDGDGDGDVDAVDMRRQLHQFFKLHWINLLFYSYLFTIAACVIVLTVDLEPQPLMYNGTLHSASYVAAKTLAESSGITGRMLRGGGGVMGGAEGESSIATVTMGSLGGFQTMAYAGDDSEVNGILWLCLFFATFLMMPFIAFKLFTPIEDLNIFMISIFRMLQHELIIFMILFGFFMAMFYISLYTLYPRAGLVQMPQVEQFNNFYNSLRSLFELAFTGSPALVNLDLDFSILSYSQSVDFALWLVFYLLFIILSLILLLNLLIALLSFTFDAVRNESTLECRTSFAQCLMRLELRAASLKWNVNAGVPNAEGDYTYDFRSVQSLNSDPAASEGDAEDGANTDPFAIPDGGPLARIESKLERMEEQLAKLEKWRVLKSMGATGIAAAASSSVTAVEAFE